MTSYALGIYMTNFGIHVAAIDDNHYSFPETASDHTVNLQESQRQLGQQILHTLSAASLQPSQINAIGVGISGIDRQPHNPALSELLAEMFPGRSVQIEHESVALLLALYPFGVVMFCNTDSFTVGINQAGKRIWVGGWGNQTDQGSTAIGREVVSAVANAFDEVGKQTALLERVMLRLKLQSADELRNWNHSPDRTANDFAALAVEAVILGNADAVASGIILRAADRFASQAQTAARRLGLHGQRFPVSMVGSFFVNPTLLRTLFQQTIEAAVPGATLHYFMAPNIAYYSAVMALDRELGIVPQLELLSQNKSLRRATERRNPLTMDIQDRPTRDFVRLMNAEDQRVPRLIEPELDKIAMLIDQTAERYAKGGRLFFVGAGTSGRLAVLDAAECRPTFSTTLEEVAGILAGGEAAMINSIEGAEDDEGQGADKIAMRDVGELDTVIGIAASGSTPFVIGAVREARDRGALTGCIVNNTESAIASLVQHPIVIATGPEVIMGSTRLKAGTAQKLVLNMISTGVMMRVGRTYGNLMTDMQMSNIKLRKRAAVIVAEATELPLDEATVLLERCDNEMKTAIAAHLLKLSPDEARVCLEKYNGNLYRCIQVETNRGL